MRGNRKNKLNNHSITHTLYVHAVNQAQGCYLIKIPTSMNKLIKTLLAVLHLSIIPFHGRKQMK